MAPTSKEATFSSDACCHATGAGSTSLPREAAPVASANAVQDWNLSSTDRADDRRTKNVAMPSLVRPVDEIPEPSTNASSKGTFPLPSLLIFFFRLSLISLIDDLESRFKAVLDIDVL
ncbi:hypothetical protein SDJN02_14125, partial [Cucurbita argyrosperma subsp. argyrosperma]